jgi:hypothetical protein
VLALSGAETIRYGSFTLLERNISRIREVDVSKYYAETNKKAFLSQKNEYIVV